MVPPNPSTSGVQPAPKLAKIDKPSEHFSIQQGAPPPPTVGSRSSSEQAGSGGCWLASKWCICFGGGMGGSGNMRCCKRLVAQERDVVILVLGWLLQGAGLRPLIL